MCVVGSGLSGAVISERYANQMNQRVLVLEKRTHIGGNCYDYIDDQTGIRVNLYGAHLFHTNHRRVWEYIQLFSEWTPYEHHVLAAIDGKHVPVPVNIDTVNSLLGTHIQSSEEMDEWLKSEQVPSAAPNNSEEMALSRVGKRLYEKLFKPYTIKQWSKTPAQLGPEVLARIPVRNTRDGRYFSDTYQALPRHGYTNMFRNMLAHPLIEIFTNIDYFDVKNSIWCNRTYFTGPIDAYFAHLGWEKLEYRSLDFQRKVIRNVDYFQPGSVVNYPSANVNYTRIVEYKHFLNQSSPHTVVFYEFSKDGGDPYYPVPNPRNKALYDKYQAMAAKERGVTFVGRLANYKYFNMDESILNALELFDRDTNRTFTPLMVPVKPPRRWSEGDYTGTYPPNTDRLRMCSEAKMINTSQWRSLFPGGNLSVSGKALVSIVIGMKARNCIALLIDSMGHRSFDYLFFSHDNFSWVEEPWYTQAGVTVLHIPGGRKWQVMYDYLTPAKVALYSHLFLWDDDLQPAPGFDGEVMLQFLQAFRIEIAQPVVRKNGHPPNVPRKHDAPIRETFCVEVQVPCYSTKTWLECIRPRMIQTFLQTGWGIDAELHGSGDCAPNHQYALNFPLDHMDFRTLPKGKGHELGFLEWNEYKQRARLEKWPRKRKAGQALYSYSVEVNADCQLRMRSTGRWKPRNVGDVWNAADPSWSE